MAEEKELNIIIVALGTMGDLNPLLQVGSKLKALGHSVTVLSDAGKQSFVEERGLQFQCILSEREWQAFIGHPGLWDRHTSDAIVYRHLMMPTVFPIVAFVEESLGHAKTLLIGDVKTLGLRIANEKFGLPLVNIHLAPEYSNSFGEYEEAQQEITVVNQLNQLRARFGLLDPLREYTMDWASRCDLCIYAYPEWFHGSSNTNNQKGEWFDFIVDEQENENIPADVLTFLEAGEAPVIFTLGTGLGVVDTFFEASAKTCETLNLRAIFLCKEASHIPSNLPPSILVKKYLPMSKLLEKSRAIVHHGGVGTTAQALRKGLPQLILPMAFDQFGNAARVTGLGAGQTLSMQQLNAPALSEMLGTLLGNETLKQRCRSISERFGENLAAQIISERISELGNTYKVEAAPDTLDIDFI